MRLRNCLSLIALMAAAPAAVAADGPQTDWPALDDGVTAFVGVSVLPMDEERILKNQTVIVSGGRIEAMGDAKKVKPPKGAREIDGRGKYLIPGLIDMHAHIGQGSHELADAFGRQVALSLATGVTTVRGLVAPPDAIAKREAARSGAFVSPALIVASQSINANSVKDPAAARAFVKSAADAGYDALKIHGGLDRATYDAVIEQAAAEGLRLIGHVSQGYGLARAIDAGQDIEHLDGFVAAALPEDAAPPDGQFIFDDALLARVEMAKVEGIARAMKAKGTCNGATLGLFRAYVGGEVDALAARPEVKYVPKATVDQWRNIRGQFPAPGDVGAARFLDQRDAFTRTLRDAGVKLVASSDSPSGFMVSGFAMHREMDAYRRAGLTPFEALRTATSDAAACLGEFGADIGVIAAGKRADLVLVDGDPLQNPAAVESPAGVMARGKWLPGDELKAMLASVEAAAAALP